MHYEKDGLGQYLVPDASDAITNCGYIMALRHGFVMPCEKEFRIHYPQFNQHFSSTAALYARIRQHLVEDIEKGCNFGELVDALNPNATPISHNRGVLFNLQDTLASEINVISKRLCLPDDIDLDGLSKILFCTEHLSEIVEELQTCNVCRKIWVLNELKTQLERFSANLEWGARAYKGYEQFDFDYTKYVDFDKYLEVIEHILTRIDRLMKFNSTIRTSHFVGQAVSREVHKFTQAVNDSLSSFGDIAELSIEPINEDVVMRFIMNNIHLASRDDCDKYTPVNNPTNNFQ